jgi:predicted nucleic acid-binding Zn ribbon protein
VQFKGTGWYVTDYARASSSQSAKNGGKSSESKPGTKADTAKTEAAKSEPAKSESQHKRAKK